MIKIYWYISSKILLCLYLFSDCKCHPIGKKMRKKKNKKREEIEGDNLNSMKIIKKISFQIKVIVRVINPSIKKQIITQTTFPNIAIATGQQRKTTAPRNVANHKNN